MHLFAVLSASVAFINWQSEEAIAVIVDREAAANVQNGISSSTSKYVIRTAYNVPVYGCSAHKYSESTIVIASLELS
jgi:hypothetical protein